jgi:hypothetical protein
MIPIVRERRRCVRCERGRPRRGVAIEIGTQDACPIRK